MYTCKRLTQIEMENRIMKHSIVVAIFVLLVLRTSASAECKTYYTHDSTTCCECADNHYLSRHGQNTCVPTCPAGMYRSPNQECNATNPRPTTTHSEYVCCHEACANCTAESDGPSNCLACSDRYFRLEAGGISHCVEACVQEQYRNYDDGICSRCTDQFHSCMDCETVNGTHTRAAALDCDTWCGDQKPKSFQSEPNITLMCRFSSTDDESGCKMGSFLVEGCACCVKACHEKLQQDGRRCKQSSLDKIQNYMFGMLGKCRGRRMVCIGTGGVACLVIIAMVGICCYRCHANRGSQNIRSAHDNSDTRGSNKPMSRADTNVADERIHEQHPTQPPEPPPLRKRSETSFNNMDTCRRQLKKKIAGIPEIPGTSADTGREEDVKSGDDCGEDYIDVLAPDDEYLTPQASAHVPSPASTPAHSEPKQNMRLRGFSTPDPSKGDFISPNVCDDLDSDGPFADYVEPKQDCGEKGQRFKAMGAAHTGAETVDISHNDYVNKEIIETVRRESERSTNENKAPVVAVRGQSPAELGRASAHDYIPMDGGLQAMRHKVLGQKRSGPF